MNILSAKNLFKAFKQRTIVNDVSIEIKSGEIVGLLGPNGAGKTTCFYIIVGLIASDKGHVFLDNNDITLAPMYIRARYGLGYLPQEASIFRKMTVEQNLASILELNPSLDNHGKAEKLETLLAEFHIGHIRKSKGISLSGGERRRVEIARVLAIEPKFILLDEPFAGIDPISVIDIKRIIKHLSDRGIGILITDHNVRDTLTICQKAYIMSEGKIIANGDPKTILSNRQVRDVYLGDEFYL